MPLNNNKNNNKEGTSDEIKKQNRETADLDNRVKINFKIDNNDHNNAGSNLNPNKKQDSLESILIFSL